MSIESINFSVKGKHEMFNGNAAIVNNYKDGIYMASQIFESKWQTRKIGTHEGFRHDDVKYAVYENYIDSDSIHYFYFAIEIND